MSKKRKPPTNPIPGWAWIFAVACGIIPVLTLGGAIPGAIGFGGAAGCITIAREPTMPVGSRVAICVAITAGCWIAVDLLFGGFAMLTGRPN